jgi:hypothetical protein
MDLLGMIGELREEWQRLNDAIAALERLAHQTGRSKGRPPGSVAAGSADVRASSAELPSASARRRRAKPPDQPTSRSPK